MTLHLSKKSHIVNSENSEKSEGILTLEWMEVAEEVWARSRWPEVFFKIGRARGGISEKKREGLEVWFFFFFCFYYYF